MKRRKTLKKLISMTLALAVMLALVLPVLSATASASWTDNYQLRMGVGGWRIDVGASG